MHPPSSLHLLCVTVLLQIRWYGKRNTYASGVLLLALSTGAFALIDQLHNSTVYALACLVLRMLQGFGAALAETSAYALVASVDREALSLNLGVTEVSTGLGYMLGPAAGGLLFARGGFATPFVVTGAALAAAAAFARFALPASLSQVAPRQQKQLEQLVGTEVGGNELERLSSPLALLSGCVVEAFRPLRQLLGCSHIAAIASVGLLCTSVPAAAGTCRHLSLPAPLPACALSRARLCPGRGSALCTPRSALCAAACVFR
jgi:MFS family permease